MKKLTIATNPKVDETFANYPHTVREKMQFLRELVLETAKEMPSIATIQETLKWGEPSFVTKYGSTLRMDWKPKTPNQYAMYFQCTSQLVDTFRLVYPTTFRYEGKRAIIFQLDDDLPIDELKECIKATLNYHKVKDLPLLGI